ncbi:MAG: 2-oxoacid:acceptor oxidoreductase family protein [Clostridiales Family XIII bacterium]|jgi:pyruvate ferredoxin oxidoreductase gamma subunit|nr:2-oxoacid:acceptor oxidoreductase family protein [Clostridiales Family XIII bacterium]
MIEIRWHGRGGQGAKTAALLLADAAFAAGLYVQGFPEYGPERMGAPITAYNRLDDTAIRIHSNIYEPDIVVVVDETLIGAVDVTAGLKPGGSLVVNTGRPAEEVRAKFAGTDGVGADVSIYAVDAADISIRNLGRNLPNTPLLSVVARLTGVIGEAQFIGVMQEAYEEKFANKREVIAGNMTALKEAWNGAVLVSGDDTSGQGEEE